MSISKITFDATVLGGELDLTVMLDQEVVFESRISSQQQQVQVLVDDSRAADHTITITMDGKRPEHTKVNELGEIVSDCLLHISNIQLDDLDIQQVFLANSLYRHNQNNTGNETAEPFYGVMGCNGAVTTQFFSPTYVWFLKGMSKNM